jgi:hypothetical protein
MLTHDRCGHTVTVAAARRELAQTVKTHYTTCQECARPLRWVCPGCALVRSAGTVIAEEDLAMGRIVVRCSSCGADAWG